MLRSRSKTPVKNNEGTTGPESSKMQFQVQVPPSTSPDTSLDDSDAPPSKRSKQSLRRKSLKILHKSVGSQTVSEHEEIENPLMDHGSGKTTILSLQPEIIHHIFKFCDARTMLSLYRTSKWFYNMLTESNSFWKMICIKEELSNYPCINEKAVLQPIFDDDKPEAPPSEPEPFQNKTGYAGKLMRVNPDGGIVHWRKVFLRGVQMRRNIAGGNYEGWRIYANSEMPLARLTPDLDFNSIKQHMGSFQKLSMNDDLKIDWNEQYLVVFHFVRREGESCTIRVWDIENEPKFLFKVEKGIECITDKISVIKNSVVIVPSWPLAADALVMTMQIDESNNTMTDLAKFRFASDEQMKIVDDHWEHTMLRAVRDMAVVVLKAPEWQCVVVDLPSCKFKYAVKFNEVPRDFDCQQIRSFKSSVLILFSHKNSESTNCLVTMHISNEESQIKLRSIYDCKNTVDAALFTEPEEIFLMKRNGDVVLFDPNTNTETIRVKNPALTRECLRNEYQLFVNRKEQICVMQSSSEVQSGRNINVYSYDQKLMYTLNLDLCKYGLSRDESICIYTNAAFLAAADSKKFVLFDVKNGRHVGELRIPSHLERSNAKEEKYCMFDQTGLSLFIFDEDKMIAVHDYERCFPAVLDIYKFW